MYITTCMGTRPLTGVVDRGMDSARTKAKVIAALRQRMADAATGHRAAGTAISSGFPPLDALLAAGGFRAGALVEWLSDGEGLGATTLALAAAREACRAGGALVVLDRRRQFYPPAAVRLGIDPQRLLIVYAGTRAEEAWALDQALRCAAVGAVLAWPERLDSKAFRRLQLAAEEGGGLGLLVRPEKARHEPSWADVRLLLMPYAAEPKAKGVRQPAAAPFTRRVRIVLVHSRGGADGRTIEMEVSDESDSLRVAAPLADPTPRRRRRA